MTSPSARPGTRQLGSGNTHLTRKCRGFPEMHQKIRKDGIFASRLEASKNRLSEGGEMKAVSSLITGRGHNRAILLARSLARSLTHSLTLWGQIDAFMLDARSVGRIAGAGARGRDGRPLVQLNGGDSVWSADKSRGGEKRLRRRAADSFTAIKQAQEPCRQKRTRWRARQTGQEMGKSFLGSNGAA